MVKANIFAEGSEKVGASKQGRFANATEVVFNVAQGLEGAGLKLAKAIEEMEKNK